MKHLAFLLLFIQVFWLLALPAQAKNATRQRRFFDYPWVEKLQWAWGGQLKLRGTCSWPGQGSIYEAVNRGPLYDASLGTRLKGELRADDLGYLNLHYQMVLGGGDTRRERHKLKRMYSLLATKDIEPISDERSLFNLTHYLQEEDSYFLYHRLDRLSLTLLPQWGMIRLGRQAVTWGGGMLFNPMDIFNPFAPSEIERDYKTGEDMLLARLDIGYSGSFELLYVPRRDPVDDQVDWDHSSLAWRVNVLQEMHEFSFMAARHYQDFVIGAGMNGYLGNAAWRADATLTVLDQPAEDKEVYFSLVANVDYSWQWWEKNFYGYLEFYYNGLTDNDYADVYYQPAVFERINRGELFTLGRYYLSGHLNFEAHPLLNTYLTVIHNLEDSSGLIQPRAVWSITQDLELTLGGSIAYGERDTEFGGFKIPGTGLYTPAENNVYCWLSYYF